MSSKITVKKEAIMARFGGMGFHNSEANVWREMDDVQFNQYVGKVYRELSPGFSRMWGGFPEWTKEEMDAFAEYCEKMQCKVGATIYLTGHCVRYDGTGLSRTIAGARARGNWHGRRAAAHVQHHHGTGPAGAFGPHDGHRFAGHGGCACGWPFGWRLAVRDLWLASDFCRAAPAAARGICAGHFVYSPKPRGLL